MAIAGDKKIRKHHRGLFNPLQWPFRKAITPAVPNTYVFKDSDGYVWKDDAEGTFKDG